MKAFLLSHNAQPGNMIIGTERKNTLKNARIFIASHKMPAGSFILRSCMHLKSVCKHNGRWLKNEWFHRGEMCRGESFRFRQPSSSLTKVSVFIFQRVDSHVRVSGIVVFQYFLAASQCRCLSVCFSCSQPECSGCYGVPFREDYPDRKDRDDKRSMNSTDDPLLCTVRSVSRYFAK